MKRVPVATGVTSGERLGAAATRHRPQLDGLRAVAILAVFIEHFCPSMARVPFWGHMGVLLFFVLSGFLITGILLRCRNAVARSQSVLWTARQFYIRRFLRIFPAYYALLLALYVYGFTSVRESILWHATYTTNIYVATQGFFPGVVGHFWSLSVEEQFYLGWPWVIMCIPQRYLQGTIVAAICLGPLSRAAVLPSYGLLGVTLAPCCLDSLALGALLAFAEQQKMRWFLCRFFGARALLTLATLSVLAVLLIQFVGMPYGVAVLADFVHAWFFACLVWGGATGYPGAARFLLENRVALYIGKISYGLYLYHIPALFAFRFFFDGTAWVSEPVVFAACTAITIVCASVSWHLFEAPLNGLKRYFEYYAEPRSADPAGAEARHSNRGSPEPVLSLHESSR